MLSGISSFPAKWRLSPVILALTDFYHTCFTILSHLFLHYAQPPTSHIVNICPFSFLYHIALNVLYLWSTMVSLFVPPFLLRFLMCVTRDHAAAFCYPIMFYSVFPASSVFFGSIDILGFSLIHLLVLLRRRCMQNMIYTDPCFNYECELVQKYKCSKLSLRPGGLWERTDLHKPNGASRPANIQGRDIVEWEKSASASAL